MTLHHAPAGLLTACLTFLLAPAAHGQADLSGTYRILETLLETERRQKGQAMFYLMGKEGTKDRKDRQCST